MSSSDDPKTRRQALRSKAEQHLRLTREAIATMTSQDVQEIVHELQVHQIELEMQNEALSQAQAETEATRAKFQDLYDFAPVGYLTLSNEDVILEANQLAGKLLGVETQRLIGRKFTDFIKPDSRAVHFLHRRAVFRTHERQECQVELDRTEPLYLHLHSHADIGNDETCRTVLADITMTKRLEARLSHLAKAAQAANTAKSQFLANMSHEIRTPLNAIIGLSSLLEPMGLNEKQDLFVKTLNASAQNLLVLVNDLLDFSKLESGRVELDIQPFDLLSSLRTIQNMLAVSANEKGLSLFLEYPDSLPKFFAGDNHKIRQILINLISNAVKFTESGLIIVRVNGTEQADDSYKLNIGVIDNGIGVPGDKREKIFESFTQADGSMTRRFGGTGLGLSISRHLARSMDGDITVDDNPNGGSIFCFTISLPTTAPVFPPQALETMDPGTRIHRPRVLLVEDQAANILVATTYLERFGCEVDVSQSGRDAIAKAATSAYELILMDVEMPEMSGVEAARQIRQHEKESGAKRAVIIALTAHVLTKDRQRCLDAGMDDYLSKPFNPVELQKRIINLPGPDLPSL